VLTNADVFIQIGASLEFWAPKMISASDNKKLKVIILSEGIELIAEEEHNDNGERNHDHVHSSGNPHIWLDPVLVKDMAKRIYDELKSMNNNNSEELMKNFNAFIKELDALNKYLVQETGKFKIKEIVSFHPAWAYFERRYGLREVGVIQASPGREPSIKDIQEIIKQIRKYNITTIFAEPQLPRKAADIIASESGVKVLILDPLGATDENGMRGYIDHIKSNFEIMKKAMN
jgi:zinc transport system substrate-binding protein